MILDEPTASLDAESKKIVMDTLQEESKYRLCIMVCHDQTENYHIFDRILKFSQNEMADVKIEELTSCRK